MKHKRLALILALLVALGASGGALAMSSPGYVLPWQAESAGGGGASSSTNYAANITVGQTATSTSSSDGFSVSLGYWQEADTTHLPFISE